MQGSDRFPTGPLSQQQLELFERDGFLLLEAFLDAEEVALLMSAAKEDAALAENAYGVEDASGRQTRLASWNHPSEDVFGALSRSRRVVDSMEQLLGGEVYHYHSKLMLKEPRVGGAWEWHQDYGYWYQNGCLLPDMASEPLRHAFSCGDPDLDDFLRTDALRLQAQRVASTYLAFFEEQLVAYMTCWPTQGGSPQGRGAIRGAHWPGSGGSGAGLRVSRSG